MLQIPIIVPSANNGQLSLAVNNFPPAQEHEIVTQKIGQNQSQSEVQDNPRMNGNEQICQTPKEAKEPGQKGKKAHKAKKCDTTATVAIQAQSKPQEVQLSEYVTKPSKAMQEECIMNEQNPLWKTRLCKFSPFGLCRRGDNCHYAHGTEELRHAPDFSKTAICPNLLRLGTCNEATCRYAHHRQELREVKGLMKTKMCRFHANGGCFLGSFCRFAHVEGELGPEGDAASNYDASTYETSSTYADESFTSSAGLAIEFNKVLSGAVEESSMSANYQGMSPDNTPLCTPRACHYPPGVWTTTNGAFMRSADVNSDPPTPDPVLAWQMQQESTMAVQSMTKGMYPSHCGK